MKRFFIAAFSLLALLASCNDPNEGNDPQQEPTQEQIDSIFQATLRQMNSVEYTINKSEQLTKEEMADFIFGPAGANSDEGVEEARKRYLERCSEIEDSMANALSMNAFTLIFEKINYNYQTIDQNGDPITLSAFMGFGEYLTFSGWAPLDQDHIYLCCPYTHTKEDECATADEGGYEFTLLMGDNLFIMPDGQGFGTNKNHDQMYLNHELQARQIYDALVAGKRIYENEWDGEYEDDCTLRVIGASQGAGDALAVHKYLDTQRAFSDEDLAKMKEDLAKTPFLNSTIIQSMLLLFQEMTCGQLHNFEYSYAACGPYCPKATLEQYYLWGQMAYPCVFPLIIKSFLASDAAARAKYTEDRFYSDLYNANKAYFDEVYLKKTLNSDDLNKEIRKRLKVGSEKEAPEALPLDRILSAEALDTNSEMYADIAAWLDKQDLTKGWTPRTKTYLYYSKADEVVPYVNTIKLMELFGSKCSAEEAFWKGHVACCEQFMLKPW